MILFLEISKLSLHKFIQKHVTKQAVISDIFQPF